MKETFYRIADTVVKIVGEKKVIGNCFDKYEIDPPAEGEDYIEWIIEEDVPPSQQEEWAQGLPVYRSAVEDYEICYYEGGLTVRHPENVANRVSMIKFEENMQKATFYIPHYGDEHDWEFSREAKVSFMEGSLDAFCLAMHKRGGILLKGMSIDSEDRGVFLASVDIDAAWKQTELWTERYGAKGISDGISLCKVSKNGVSLYGLPWDKVQEKISCGLACTVFIGGHDETEVSFLPREETRRRLVGMSTMPEWLEIEDAGGASPQGNLKLGREREIIAKKISELVGVSVLVGEGAGSEVIDLVRNML